MHNFRAGLLQRNDKIGALVRNTASSPLNSKKIDDKVQHGTIPEIAIRRAASCNMFFHVLLVAKISSAFFSNMSVCQLSPLQLIGHSGLSNERTTRRGEEKKVIPDLSSEPFDLLPYLCCQGRL